MVINIILYFTISSGSQYFFIIAANIYCAACSLPRTLERERMDVLARQRRKEKRAYIKHTSTQYEIVIIYVIRMQGTVEDRKLERRERDGANDKKESEAARTITSIAVHTVSK
jgi:hypothetical protein